MKKLLGWMLALTLVAYLVFKGVAFFAVRQVMQEVERVLAPVATLSYGGVYSSVTGEAGVRDVMLQPFALREPLRVDEVGIRVRNGLQLMELLRNDLHHPPSEMAVHFSGVQLALTKDWLQDWAQASAQDVNGYRVYACGGVESLGVQELLQMGLTKLVTDLSVSWRHDPYRERLDVRVDTDMRELGSGDLRLSLTAPSSLTVQAMKDFMPKPVRLDWTLRDAGFMRRTAAFCAKKLGVKVDDYSPLAGQAWETRMAESGLKPSPSLRRLFEDYTRDGGELSIVLQPHENIEWDKLAFYKAQDAATLLGLAVSYNGASITDTYMELAPELASRLSQPEPVVAEQKPVAPVVAPPPAASKNEPSWVTVPPETAMDYLGKNVRLKTSGGRDYEGILSSPADEVFQVTTAMGAGHVIFNVSLNEIAELRVLRKGSK